MATPQRPISGNYSSQLSSSPQVDSGGTQGVTRSLSQSSISHQSLPSQLAKRPGFGKLGTPVKAKVNFYRVDLSNTPPIFDYTVFLHSKDRKDSEIQSRIRSRVIQLLLEGQAFQNASSDYSKRIVSTKQIRSPQGQDFSCTVDYYEPDETGPRSGDSKLQFQVLVKQTGQFDMRALAQYLANANSTLPDIEKYTSALNIFFSRAYSQNVYMAVSGRRAKFFNVGVNGKNFNLNFGLNVFQGYFRAVKPTIHGLMLNVNTAAAIMIHTGPLHQVIREMVRSHARLDQERQLATLGSELKFVRVKHQYFGHAIRKTIFGIATMRDEKGVLLEPTASNIKFLRDQHPQTKQAENKYVTVAQHFRDAYPGTRRVDESAWVVNLGSKDRPNYVPSDLLEALPGNFYRGLLPNPTQGAIMIKSTCRRPGDNKALIQNTGLRQLGIGASNGPHERFNIVVNKEMTAIDARMLPAPPIVFAPIGNNKSAVPDKRTLTGRWNLARVKFKTSCTPVKMSWLELRSSGFSSATNLQEFLNGVENGVKNYCSFTTKMVTIPGFPHSRPMPDNLTVPMMQSVLKSMKQHSVRLVFILLPDKSADTYSTIKLAGDVIEGIHTICTASEINKQSARSGGEHTTTKSVKASVGEVGNLMLKFNMKLGGTNLAVQTDSKNILHNLLGKPIMFVGADVGHPAPGSMQGAPSIAGIVATTDQACFRYAGSIRLQNHYDDNKKSIEYILQFQDMMAEHLKLFQKRNNQNLPEVIVVYRDGVADTMFTECVAQEVAQIKQACRMVYGTQQQPQLVFIVAQKRHHTRFYRADGVQSGDFDANGNPKPGFIVDNQICDTRLWDWYLISHICLQGTSRAAHYTVLHNETNLTADQIQLLTHYQCWLLGRSTTSISIHPATRHADILCDRARVYLRSVYVPKDPYKSYVAKEHWPGHMHPEVKDDMFWI